MFLGLITDRNMSNVNRRNELAVKGWANMTAAERVEWMGDPYEVARYGNHGSPINLASNTVVHQLSTTPTWRNGSVILTSAVAAINSHIVVLIGNASDYAGRQLTLSVESIVTKKGAPRIELHWYDDENNHDSAAEPITSAGTVTMTLGRNEKQRKYLTMWLHTLTPGSTATVNVSVQYKGLMLELGSVGHPYVPYTPIVATAATKGAYNYSDLNRVELAISELSEWFGSDLVSKTDWGIWDVPTTTDFDRIWHNLTSLARLCRMEKKLEGIPSDFRKLTFSHANQIEQFLFDVSALM